MSISICGFLEISSLDEQDLAEDYAWMSCIDVGSLNLLTGDECSILFGESKYAHDPPEWPPIAHRRGLPTNMSYLTAQAAKEANENNSTGVRWGFTHISYDEIKQIDWQAYPDAQLLDLTMHYSWGLLFQLMKTLDEASKSQRLIIWFEW